MIGNGIQVPNWEIGGLVLGWKVPCYLLNNGFVQRLIFTIFSYFLSSMSLEFLDCLYFWKMNILWDWQLLIYCSIFVWKSDCFNRKLLIYMMTLDKNLKLGCLDSEYFTGGFCCIGVKFYLLLTFVESGGCCTLRRLNFQHTLVYQEFCQNLLCQLLEYNALTKLAFNTTTVLWFCFNLVQWLWSNKLGFVWINSSELLE